MGWEQRAGCRYYYRKKREKGRIRSEYVGTGLLAELCAATDSFERLQQAAKRAAGQAVRRAEAEIDRQLANAESALAAMTKATLYSAGYHKHKGQWRKKRH